MDTRPRIPLISFCSVQLQTLCAAHSLATLCLYTTSGPDPVELPGFWGSMVFRHAPIPRKGSGKQQQHKFFVSTFKIGIPPIALLSAKSTQVKVVKNKTTEESNSLLKNLSEITLLLTTSDYSKHNSSFAANWWYAYQLHNN